MGVCIVPWHQKAHVRTAPFGVKRKHHWRNNRNCACDVIIKGLYRYWKSHWTITTGLFTTILYSFPYHRDEVSSGNQTDLGSHYLHWSPFIKDILIVVFRLKARFETRRLRNKASWLLMSSIRMTGFKWGPASICNTN